MQHLIELIKIYIPSLIVTHISGKKEIKVYIEGECVFISTSAVNVDDYLQGLLTGISKGMGYIQSLTHTPPNG